jgi:hypothetical protein
MSLQLRLTLLAGLLTGGMALLFGLLVYPPLQAQLLGSPNTRLRAGCAFGYGARGCAAELADQPMATSLVQLQTESSLS